MSAPNDIIYAASGVQLGSKIAVLQDDLPHSINNSLFSLRCSNGWIKILQGSTLNQLYDSGGVSVNVGYAPYGMVYDHTVHALYMVVSTKFGMSFLPQIIYFFQCH